MAREADRSLAFLQNGAEQVSGRDALEMNIRAGRSVADAVRSTLGPNGLDKLLFKRSEGKIVVTNDGASILDAMAIDHPIARRIVDLAAGQEDTAGDGTTTAVVLAGQLLDEAGDLLDVGLHQTSITRGYWLAAERAREVLQEEAVEVTPDDDERLRTVAQTAITGKWAEGQKRQLSDVAVRAIRSIADGRSIDLDDVYVRTASGTGVEQSALVEGLVIDLDRSSSSLSDIDPRLPERIEAATIAFVDYRITVEKAKATSHYTVSDPEAHRRIAEHEDARFQGFVDQLRELGVDVLFCQKSIDDSLKSLLAKAGIYAVERTRQDEITNLARITGGELAFDVDELTSSYLGRAGLVERETFGSKEFLVITECSGGAPVSIFLRGATTHVLDELERIMDDCLRVVKATVESGSVVPGGGASEMAVSNAITEYAGQEDGREQLAVAAFADALTIVPRILAQTAGADPVDTVIELRTRHHAGDTAAGVDVVRGEVANMLELDVIEPLPVKERAIVNAQETANMILRIDDVIAASPEKGGNAHDHDMHLQRDHDSPPWMIGH